MDDTLFDECEKPITDLSEHFDSLFFRSMVSFFDIFGEISITQLLDDIVIFGWLHDIMEHDDIFGM